MRIISGKYKGKVIDGYNIEGTRPTMDRVKESLIASVYSNISDSICLDLFTGSGSVGLELLSNGAKKCYFVDSNPKVIEVLNKNINKLNLKEEYKLLKNDFKDALLNFKNNNIKFDIIFLDPPYKFNLISQSLELIEKYDLLNDDGIIICEYETEEINNYDFNILKEKKIWF